jgi:hypothetical protein
MRNSHWIWLGALREEPNTYVDFRKEFHLAEAPQGPVKVAVSACQEYMLYVNGELIGRGPSPCTPEWQYFDEYDLSGKLVAGSNVVGAIGYHFGDKDIVIEQMQGQAGFLLELVWAGGELLSTDGEWSCRRSPRYETRNHRISKWSGYNEIYVAQREDEWLKPGFALDAGWEKAAVIARADAPDSPWKHLIPREIPFLHKEEVRPSAIVRVESNYGSVTGEEHLLAIASEHRTALPGAVKPELVADASVPYSLPGVVYDFGREVVGRPVLVIDAPQGGVLRIAYGESLELQYVDTFVLRAGVQELSPFGRRACRFMQLTFMATPEPIAVQSLSFFNQHYAFSKDSKWESDDEALNRIWSISRYTTLMNSHDHLEDCPWREKALWVADAVVMGKVIYHLFGDTALLRKCLLQGARIQNEDGSIPGTGPERNAMLLPDFCAHWLLGVRDYYRYSGDQDLLKELLPVLHRLMGWFAAERDGSGLIGNAVRPGWFCFIDWTTHIDRRDKVSAISMLYYAAAKAMEELCEAAGEQEAAAAYAETHHTLGDAIRGHLWLEEKGAYSDCMDGEEVSSHLSLQTNFLAAWCGLMSPSEMTAFIETYYDTGKLVEIKGAFFQHIVLEVLAGLGMTGRALSLIRSFWGAMAERGATTWWETFDPSSPSCTVASTYQGNVPTYLWEGPLLSQCHAWGASPAYMLHHLVTGVNVLRLGEGIITLTKPAEEGPSRLQTVLPTRHGGIEVAWERKDGGYTGACRIPRGLKVEKTADYPEGIVIETVEMEELA